MLEPCFCSRVNLPAAQPGSAAPYRCAAGAGCHWGCEDPGFLLFQDVFISFPAADQQAPFLSFHSPNPAPCLHLAAAVAPARWGVCCLHRFVPRDQSLLISSNSILLPKLTFLKALFHEMLKMKEFKALLRQFSELPSCTDLVSSPIYFLMLFTYVRL